MTARTDLSSLAADLQAIADSESDNFLSLVAAAGLDPSRDFVGADLRGADLRHLDLRAFDFTGANLSGVDTQGAAFNETVKLAIGVGSPEVGATGDEWIELDSRLPATELPPPDAIGLMTEVRRASDVFAQKTALRRLLSLHSDFVEPRTIARLTRLFRRSRAGRAPEWLRDYLIERLSVCHSLAVSLINSAFADLYGEPPPLEQVAIKKVLWNTSWPLRKRALNDLIQSHRSSVAVQTLLRTLALQDTEEHVRSVAIAGIEPISEDWASFKEFMRSIYITTEGSLERAAALRQLARLRRADGEVMTMIVSAALDMEHPFVRSEAVLALEEYVGASDLAANLIGKSLFGPSDQGKLAAISVVERALAASTTDLKKILYDVYFSAKNELGKVFAISAIYRSVPADETLYTTLMNEVAVFDPKDFILREEALKILAARYLDRSEVVDALKRYANADDHYSSVRLAALQGIGKFYATDESIRGLIHDRCCREEHDYTQAAALEIVASNWFEGDDKSIGVLRKAFAERPEGFSWASRARKIIDDVGL